MYLYFKKDIYIYYIHLYKNVLYVNNILMSFLDIYTIKINISPVRLIM